MTRLTVFLYGMLCYVVFLAVFVYAIGSSRASGHRRRSTCPRLARWPRLP
jgi:hypothetical protein